MNKYDVNRIRAFNRFYTRIIGLLDKFLLKSQFTLPEVRIMYEIYHAGEISAKKITELLDMDKGYLSRILLSFDKKALIKKSVDSVDSRIQLLSLSAPGKKEFEKLNKASENQITDLLTGLNQQEISELIIHMDAIQDILSKVSRK